MPFCLQHSSIRAGCLPAGCCCLHTNIVSSVIPGHQSETQRDSSREYRVCVVCWLWLTESGVKWVARHQNKSAMFHLRCWKRCFCVLFICWRSWSHHYYYLLSSWLGFRKMSCVVVRFCLLLCIVLCFVARSDNLWLDFYICASSNYESVRLSVWNVSAFLVMCIKNRTRA